MCSRQPRGGRESSPWQRGCYCARPERLQRDARHRPGRGPGQARSSPPAGRVPPRCSTCHDCTQVGPLLLDRAGAEGSGRQGVRPGWRAAGSHMGRLHATVARPREDIHASRVTNAGVQEDGTHQLGRQSLNLQVLPLRATHHRQAVQDCQLGRGDATDAEVAAGVGQNPQASRVAGEEEEESNADCLRGGGTARAERSST